MSRLPFLLGRVALGGFFLYSGINHFRNRRMMAQYAGSKKVPAAEAAVLASGALAAASGAAVLLGIKPRLGAAGIAAFLAAVSPVMHDFWRVEDPQQRSAEMVNFSKNLALLGAALTLIGLEEPWPVSVPVAQPKAIERARTAVRSARSMWGG
jgi:putative oxidoreductase